MVGSNHFLFPNTTCRSILSIRIILSHTSFSLFSTNYPRVVLLLRGCNRLGHRTFRPRHFLLDDGIDVMTDGSPKIGRFVPIPKSQSQQGFAISGLVRNSHHEIPTGIADRQYVVVHVLVAVDEVDAGHGKEIRFARSVTFGLVGEQQQQGVAAAFDAEAALFEGTFQFPFVGAVIINGGSSSSSSSSS